MMTPKQKKQRGALLTKAHNDYAQGMTSYSFYKTHNSATSDDLVQDTFLKTWRYLVRGGEIVLMKAFLYHALNHLIIDEYRKHKKTLSLDLLCERGYEPSLTVMAHVMDVFDSNVALSLLLQLPEKYQRVLRMRYVEDRSLKEISVITKQSKNTVAVQLHRGLAKLRVLCVEKKLNQ